MNYRPSSHVALTFALPVSLFLVSSWVHAYQTIPGQGEPQQYTPQQVQEGVDQWRGSHVQPDTFDSPHSRMPWQHDLTVKDVEKAIKRHEGSTVRPDTLVPHESPADAHREHIDSLSDEEKLRLKRNDGVQPDVMNPQARRMDPRREADSWWSSALAKLRDVFSRQPRVLRPTVSESPAGANQANNRKGGSRLELPEIEPLAEGGAVLGAVAARAHAPMLAPAPSQSGAVVASGGNTKTTANVVANASPTQLATCGTSKQQQGLEAARQEYAKLNPAKPIQTCVTGRKPIIPDEVRRQYAEQNQKNLNDVHLDRRSRVERARDEEAMDTSLSSILEAIDEAKAYRNYKPRKSSQSGLEIALLELKAPILLPCSTSFPMTTSAPSEHATG